MEITELYDGCVSPENLMEITFRVILRFYIIQLCQHMWLELPYYVRFINKYPAGKHCR